MPRRVSTIRGAMERPFADDSGKAVSGLVLALLTVLATIVAGLQGDANSHAAQGMRIADRLGIEASSLESVSQLRAGTQYAIWERWFEQQQRNYADTDASQANPEAPRAKVLQILATVDAQIGDWMKAQTPLLQPPYFDEQAQTSDFTTYDAEQNTGPAELARQRQRVEDRVATAWDNRGSDYITILTIIAVALFFVGLGSQLRRPARLLLTIAGMALGVGALVWTVFIASAPIVQVPDEAVQHEAASAASFEIAYATQNQLTDAQQQDFEKAIDEADAALAVAPQYAAARERRADGELGYAEKLRFVEGPSAKSSDLATRAVDDYQAVVDAGEPTFITWSNLGWAAFLAGDTQRAIAASDTALSLQDGTVIEWLNRATIRAVAGDDAGARADVESGLQAAVKSDQGEGTTYLSNARYYLLGLAKERPDRAALLRALERRIAEGSVAITLHGSPAVPATVPTIASTSLSTLRVAPDGTIDVSEPAIPGESSDDPDAVGYRLTLDASDVPAGSMVSARLTIGGIEEPGYSADQPWPQNASEAQLDLLTPYGRAKYLVDPGDYAMQVYVDGATVETLDWSVPQDRPPALALTPEQFRNVLVAFGWACDSGTDDQQQPLDTCTSHSDGVTFGAYLTTKPSDGSLIEIQLDATADDKSADAGTPANEFFKATLEQLYGTSEGDDLAGWVAQRGLDFGQIRARGTWVQSQGDGNAHRWLTILPG